MLEHRYTPMNEPPRGAPGERRGQRTDRRMLSWHPGQPERRRGPVERRQNVRPLDAAAEAAARAPDRHFVLQAEGALFVRGDMQRLRQVLDELLRNALKYAGDGEIRVQVWSEQDQVVLAVADSGPGLAPDELERC